MYGAERRPLIEVKLSSKSFGTAETSSFAHRVRQPGRPTSTTWSTSTAPSARRSRRPWPDMLLKGSHPEDKSFSPGKRRLERAANGLFPNFPSGCRRSSSPVPCGTRASRRPSASRRTRCATLASPSIGIAPRTAAAAREPGLKVTTSGTRTRRPRLTFVSPLSEERVGERPKRQRQPSSFCTAAVLSHPAIFASRFS